MIWVGLYKWLQHMKILKGHRHMIPYQKMSLTSLKTPISSFHHVFFLFNLVIFASSRFLFLYRISKVGAFSGWVQQDVGGYANNSLQLPRFCCTNPRVDVNGTTVFAKSLGDENWRGKGGDIEMA